VGLQVQQGAISTRNAPFKFYRMQVTLRERNCNKYSGQKFGKLTIIGFTRLFKKMTRVSARCECGVIKEYALCQIINGNTKSCGCSKVTRLTKHGLIDHPLYNVWQDMNDRCYNSNSKHYDRYGGRGVAVSIRWRKDFKAFYDWAIDKWKQGLELDKDKRSGGQVGDFYCPELCCFITRKENMRHTKANVYIEYNGESLCIAEWCERLNLSRSTYNKRKDLGWPVEKIFTTPVKK
jgi:hypothetical protein